LERFRKSASACGSAYSLTGYFTEVVDILGSQGKNIAARIQLNRDSHDLIPEKGNQEQTLRLLSKRYRIHSGSE
jgi:hypothetical protein